MRVLKFIVEGQIIKKDSSCNFDNLVAGTKNYLYASFAFTDEWNGRKKAATFWKLGREYPVALYGDGKIMCKIPDEVVRKGNFDVGVAGMDGDEFITTDTVTVEQRERR